MRKLKIRLPYGSRHQKSKRAGASAAQGKHPRARGHSRRKKQKGQVTIVIATMMLTFILLFLFVINTGMLINAKINLQNAADMAAYAGAATQARQLNSISYLNYEMRRQYKRFLFRYFVLGSRGFETFPPQNNGTYDFMSESGGQAFQYPHVCIAFNPKSNECKMKTLPKIEIPKSNALDMISQTLEAQLTELEKIRQTFCGRVGFTNKTVLEFWLFNPNPDVVKVKNGILAKMGSLNNPQAKEDAERMLSIIGAAASSTGLLPSELLLQERIKTLADYINAPRQEGIKLARAQELENSLDPMKYERTIQAYFSAYHTLGEHTFEEGPILDELLPGGSSAATLIQLNPIKTSFKAAYVQFKTDGKDTAQDCQVEKNTAIPVENLPVGFYKDPSLLTFYAVRLTAKAKILFSPFGEMTLRAYSAAQPFGSRIGPKPEALIWTKDMGGVTVPNIQIADNGGDGADMFSSNVLRDYNNLLESIHKSSGGSNTLTADTLMRAADAAMAPNPWESGRYNIPADFGEKAKNMTSGDAFVRYFDDQHLFAFWAPIASPEKLSQSDMGQILEDAVTASLAGTDAQLKGTQMTQDVEQAANSQALIKAFAEEMAHYVSLLAQQGGLRGEGRMIAKISDPLVDTKTFEPLPLGESFMMAPQQMKTSWNDVLNKDFENQGRTGYSVKFVSFKFLRERAGMTDGASSWQNSPEGDSYFDRDQKLISH